MLSQEHNESASSSSTTCYGSSLIMDPDVDERIASLLSSLRLTSLRSKMPQDGEDECLKKIHRQLEWLVNEEPDDHRRRRLRHILPAANCVREQVFVLRRYLHSANAASSIGYASHIHAALTAIMKESFEEEYRKLATVVGVLDAVAELLIFEVDAFGIDCPAENRTIRKLVASTLTNLTFGNAQSKRRLCSHPNLIEYVIRIIDDSHSLAQVYAGLLRNLSWMADAEMSATLAPCVAALARASVRAYRAAELKCLCATLSALWNLASHSRDNKKAICEEPGFLEMLIELLTNDAQQTVLVEPASGVLKYASMYLAVVGADQYLSTSALHMMSLRLVELLNSPSFTVIGNVLGVLSQLLAKDHQLRSHIVRNHKAVVLLNHLRNSTRDDIRNPVKTVLNYLNSSDVSGTYAPPYPPPHGVPPLGYRLDGMSSSYGGSATAAPSYLDSTRLLKYRSAQSHAAANLLTGQAPTNTVSNAADFFPYSPPPCNSTIQQGFAPRPGDRSQLQQQFSSLPRQFFQKSKISGGASSSSRGGDVYLVHTQTPRTFSPSGAVESLRYLNHPEQKDMSTSTTTTSGFAMGDSQDLDVSNSAGDDSLLNRLNRPDDPSFEVEDSVRCTRCTSAQSLSSVPAGERSTWDSCNNSAAESNRLSPLSATELPDSPTQCSRLHDSMTLSAPDFDVSTSTGEMEMLGEIGALKYMGALPDNESKADAAPPVHDVLKQSSAEGSSYGKEDVNAKDSDGQDRSVDDDYGSFMGHADSELLNQSIEAAMPKRVEINEAFLADMIEQAQPKPSLTKLGNGGGRNLSRTSTTRMHSGTSSTKTDDDDFLLQSIASVLPQSSSTRHDVSGGVGSPPKKARAMTGDTARTSNGPKQRVSRAALSNAQTNHLTHSCSVVRMKESSRPTGISLKKPTKFDSHSIPTFTSTALFDAALQSSSLVEVPKTSEKVRDASALVHQHSNEESDTLSEDNYSPVTDNAMIVDKNLPQDVVEEFQAEQLIIDCSVVSETVKQTVVRPTQKAGVIRPNISQRFGEAPNFSKRSDQEMFVLPAPLNNGSSPSSPRCNPCNPLVTSTPKNSSPSLRTTSAGRTPKHPAFVSHEKTPFARNHTSRIRIANKSNVKKIEECKNRGRYQASSLPRPKQSVLPKPRLSSTFRSSSNSRISTPRAPLCRQRAATPDTSEIFPNFENWEHGAMKLHESSMLQSQEAIKNKSARVHPFNYRNTEEKATAEAACATENDKKSKTVADTENDNSSSNVECANRTSATTVKKKIIKQMLITTV